jgi:hypothetical protein
MTRRDKCHLTATRALKLSPNQANCAWKHFALIVERLGDKDIPKFADMLAAFRVATILGKQVPK